MADVNHRPLTHLGYRRIEPNGSLKPFIDCYWFIDATCPVKTGYREFLYPDGGMGLIFNYGDTLSFNRQIRGSYAYLDGTNTRATELGLNGRIQAVGIRFKPAGASLFLNFPLHEMRDQYSALSDLRIGPISTLYDVLPSKKTYFAKVKAIEEMLSDYRLVNKSISRLTQHTINIVTATHGMFPVLALTKTLGVGERKLERLFKEQVGMPIREFAKAIRIKQARAQLKISGIQVADIALQLGFYDQAHFIKSFKSVVGLTPGEYKNRHR